MEVLVEILLNILDPKSAMTCNLKHSIGVKGLWSNPADNYCLAFPKIVSCAIWSFIRKTRHHFHVNVNAVNV